MIDAFRRYIENILRFLRNTDQPILSYVWRAWLVALIPSLLISAIISCAFAVLGYEDTFPDMSLMAFFIGGVLIAPWVETVLMWWGLAILKRIFRKTLWVCLASAIVWGALHARQPGFGLGLPAAWLFFVFSLCFLEWEKKSKAKAIKVTALIHMCQNGLVFLLMLFFVLLGVEFPEAKQVPSSHPAQQKSGPVLEARKPPAVASDSGTPKTAELTEEKKRKTFQRLFPEFGLEEYMLADEDLYPDWKRTLAANGTWREFLSFYQEFVQWRKTRGTPAEPEYKLWKEFLAQRKPG